MPRWESRRVAQYLLVLTAVGVVALLFWRLQQIAASLRSTRAQVAALSASVDEMAGATADHREHLRKLSIDHCEKAACSHVDIRRFAIESQIKQMSGPTYLVIGDSITEAAALRPVCRRAPINAGIGGATVPTFASLARQYALSTKPDLIILALGTNDSFHGSTAFFAASYTSLLRSLSDWPVAIVPIPAGEKVPAAGDFNAVLRALAAERKLLVVPDVQRLTTTDGIHLTPQAYAEWRERLEQAARTVLGAACSSP